MTNFILLRRIIYIKKKRPGMESHFRSKRSEWLVPVMTLMFTVFHALFFNLREAVKITRSYVIFLFGTHLPAPSRNPASDGGAAYTGYCCVYATSSPSERTYLLEARRHAPAAGLHDSVVPPHVLADLPVLLAPLLPAGQHRRVAEERRNTVTGQSAKRGKGGGGG